MTNPCILPTLLPFVLGRPASFNELTWFTVIGSVYDVQNPDPDQTSIVPELLEVSGFIDFFPGNQTGPFPAGFAPVVPALDHGDGTYGDTLVPIAPITARLMHGQVCTIAASDPQGIDLLANTAILGLTEPLFYHVRWRNVTFGGTIAAISNFAFQAPTGAATIDLTSPTLTTYEYGGP
jgi:hypothetical protein